MKHKLIALVIPAMLAGALLFPAVPANAASINSRQHRQHRRIEQGERSGALTGRESERLETREARIRRQEARDRRSAGRFTAVERRHIQREMNQTSRSIYHQRHDRQISHWAISPQKHDRAVANRQASRWQSSRQRVSRDRD